MSLSSSTVRVLVSFSHTKIAQIEFMKWTISTVSGGMLDNVMHFLNLQKKNKNLQKMWNSFNMQ